MFNYNYKRIEDTMSKKVYEKIGVPTWGEFKKSKCLVPDVETYKPGKGKNFEQIYHDYRFGNINWEDLTADLQEKFKFLRAFSTRGLQSKKQFDFYRSQIEQIAREHASTISMLKSERLETIDLDDPQVRGSVEVFLKAFFNIGQGFRFVAGSKFLHMHFPDLFFICDNIIIGKFEGQGLFEEIGKGHVERYLATMMFYQHVVNELIGAIRKSNKKSIAQAADQLKSLDHSRSIPRIIDKYYYG
jgi:hypothetical protein